MILYSLSQGPQYIVLLLTVNLPVTYVSESVFTFTFEESVLQIEF